MTRAFLRGHGGDIPFRGAGLHDAGAQVNRVRLIDVLAVGCVAAALAFPRAGSAQEPTRVRLAWVRGAGAEACLDQSSLESRVRARLDRDPFGADAQLVLEGSVTRKERTWHTELRVFDRTNSLVGQRDLDTVADDCAPLADAVVLAVALTIDPESATRVPASGPSDGGALAAGPKGSVETGAAAPMQAPTPALPPVQPALQPYPALPVAPSPQKTGAATMARVGARLLVGAGLLPRTTAGASIVGAYGGAHFEGTLGMSFFPETPTADGRFAFGLTLGTLGGCATTSLTRALRLGGCADLSLGAMHAVVLDTTELVSLDQGDHFFASLGLGPRLGATWGPVQFELGGAVQVAISRKNFVFRGGSPEIFESAPVGGIGYIGVGLGAP
jgi:hypothetical protein